MELHGEPMMKHFRFSHLPSDLVAVSRHFHKIAETLVLSLPSSDERSQSLLRLCEAKDWAVRAKLAARDDEAELKLIEARKAEQRQRRA